MTRVIHTGDTHIGYRQYNRPERRRDFLEAFRSVIDDAVDEDVDAVVHAGDLFHDRRPGLADLQGTVEVLRSLDDAGVPFLAVVGNHESKRDAQWLDLFEDLGLATRLGREPYLLRDVALYGLDFVPRSRRDALEYEFEPAPEAADHAVLVSHGLFEPFAHADWDTETVLEESTVAFDAVLLGDNHAADTAEVMGTWVTYCGSTERASASERDARGYNLVTFDDEVAIGRRAVADTREFVFVDVELSGGEGTDRVRERVRQHDLAEAVAIVTIEGEGDPVTPASIEELALERDALVARVNDRREIDAAEETAVSFADPDAAVRERIRELGLSAAALEIDGTVRDGSLADANVRETVERRVRELLEEDPAAFEDAPDRDPEDVASMADAGADSSDPASESAESTGDDSSAGDAGGSGDAAPDGPEGRDGAAAAGDDESVGPAAEDDEPDGTAAEDDDRKTDDADDEQVSMGDFA